MILLLLVHAVSTNMAFTMPNFYYYILNAVC